MSLLLLEALLRTIGTITAGSPKPVVENTGRSAAEPSEAEADLALPLSGARYALAIERMSIRPEPSPPPCWALPTEEDSELDACGRGPSVASWARLLSENRTEFSPRSPRSLDCASAEEGAGAARRAANTSPSSSLDVPVSSPPPNRSLTAEPPPRFSP